MKRSITTILLMILIGVMGYLMGDGGHSAPKCPTEDSCSIDYQGGKWVIREIIP